MQLLRWLLFPFTILYTLIICCRNKLYDFGIFKSKTFKVKSIVVGNLAIGGAGKSPLVLKLISHFHHQYHVATLSRGYGRKTKGFRTVNLSDKVEEVGDEPLQFKTNFPNITVAVDENRAEAIELLQKDHQLILLDDAFQHRKITGTCSILLFDYYSLLKPILLLPTGNFRDTFNQTKRANLILITKCPPIIPPDISRKISNKIRKYNQTAGIYYARIAYLPPVNLHTGLPVDLDFQTHQIVLLTGIANPKPLFTYLNKYTDQIDHFSFPDHHNFSTEDYQKISNRLERMQGNNKILLTTEKDAQRLDKTQLKSLPIFYIPITVDIENEDEFFQNLESIVNEP